MDNTTLEYPGQRTPIHVGRRVFLGEDGIEDGSDMPRLVAAADDDRDLGCGHAPEVFCKTSRSFSASRMAGLL